MATQRRLLSFFLLLKAASLGAVKQTPVLVLIPPSPTSGALGHLLAYFPFIDLLWRNRFSRTSSIFELIVSSLSFRNWRDCSIFRHTCSSAMVVSSAIRIYTVLKSPAISQPLPRIQITSGDSNSACKGFIPGSAHSDYLRKPHLPLSFILNWLRAGISYGKAWCKTTPLSTVSLTWQAIPHCSLLERWKVNKNNPQQMQTHFTPRCILRTKRQRLCSFMLYFKSQNQDRSSCTLV